MNEWLNDPALQSMDPAKKELFQMAASKVAGKSGNSMAKTMMSIITSANKKGIRFTKEEITLIMKIMKQGKSKEEQNQIDQLVQLVQSTIASKQK